MRSRSGVRSHVRSVICLVESLIGGVPLFCGTHVRGFSAWKGVWEAGSSVAHASELPQTEPQEGKVSRHQGSRAPGDEGLDKDSTPR